MQMYPILRPSDPPPELSPAFLEILGFCSHLESPTQHDINALTAIYRCLRQQLSNREKVYAARILGLMRLKA